MGSLAKHPSSTLQILGAEKALFRALKTKSATPKYGLIYHASLVGQSAPALKGKISRVLAAKLSLCCRVDALGDQVEPTLLWLSWLVSRSDGLFSCMIFLCWRAQGKSWIPRDCLSTSDSLLCRAHRGAESVDRRKK